MANLRKRAKHFRSKEGYDEPQRTDMKTMRGSLGTSLVSLVVVALLAIASPEPAAAGIQCHGDFQINKSRPIATPYCEEEQIAIVARSYEWKVTASEFHNNPLSKVSICPTATLL